MLQITRTRKFRISNRLAGFAALLLVVTSLAGVGSSGLSDANQSALRSLAMASDDSPSLFQAESSPQVKKNKGFKMSLFLFRSL